jgi:FtsH-binding integral membrane protein
MVYYEQQKPPEEERPGCLDVWLISRAMFGILLWPFAVLMGLIVDLYVIVVLFDIHPALALIPVAITAAAVWLYARWEQRRFRPPGL